MNELSRIVLQQTLTMSLYMLLGAWLFKKKIIDAEGSRSIAKMLVWIIIPSTIIKSCLVSYSTERLIQLGLSFALGILAVSLAMLVARLIFRKNPVEQFGAAFSNAAFIGIPLIQSSFGQDAVFFVVGLVIFLNLMQWTYGASLLKGEKIRLGWKDVVLNPISIGCLIGVLLFVSRLGDRLPAVVSGAVGGVAALNAPMAMIVLGVYLAQADLKDLVLNPRLYLVSLVRLIVIPALTVLLLAWLPLGSTVKLVILIAAAAPVGANVAVYSQIYGQDYAYACETVTQSTVLSIVTLPLILAFAGLLIP